MTKTTLERHQIGLYLAALLVGGGLGWQLTSDALEPVWERGIGLSLGILLYATFCQVPLMQLRQAFRHRRFIAALLVGNFGLVPLVVWGLVTLGLSDPKLQFGVFLVLLAPCTDWFLTFTYLGKGNLPLAIAATPVLLLLQSLLLPLYLGMLTDQKLWNQIDRTAFGDACVRLILLPLGLALLSEYWSRVSAWGRRWLALTGWLPVPFLALTLLLVAASQVRAIAVTSLRAMGPVVLIFAAFLLINGYLSRGIGWLFRLETDVNRTLAFSLGTRNSFVVLPLALALPDTWSGVVMVVVLQPLVELTGMIGYLWWVPHRLLTTTSAPEAGSAKT